MTDLRQQIIYGMWRRKDLTFLFHNDQMLVHQKWHASTSRKFYLGCSRRWGKSYYMCIEAAMTALEYPGCEIRYAAPTQKMAKQIVEPHFRRIFQDAPDDIRPDFRVQDQVWIFPNGSRIILAGVDNGGAERLRGTATKLALVDEAGLMDDLDYLIQDILLPQLMTVDGRILIASTPPRTPAHPFKRHCQEAMMNGAYIKRTVYDAPHITEAMIEEYQAESGGKESTTWRREYEVEFVVDENLAIVPEWSRKWLDKENKRHALVISRKMPTHFKCWVVADVGFNDLTAVGYWYVDFLLGKLRLKRERYFTRTRSSVVNDQVRQDLKDLVWPEPEGFVADTLAKNTIVDMSDDPDKVPDGEIAISWSPPPKHNAEGALNNLRVAIQREIIEFEPECVITASHFENGIWNKGKTGYERSDEFGHFDGIDMVKYAYRSIDLTENPYPDDPLPTLDNHHVRARMRSADPVEDFYSRGRNGRR